MLLAAGPSLGQDSLPWNGQDGRSSEYGQSSQNGAGYRDSGSYGTAGNDAYAPQGGTEGGNGYARNQPSYSANNDAYAPGGNGGSQGGYSGSGDSYAPSRNGYSANGDAYSGGGRARDDSFTDPGQPANGGNSGYGEPYAPPPGEGGAPYREAGPRGDGRYYEQNEIIAAGHGFFGAISQGLGSAVEYAFKSQGRPNGYILGEDAGGAFVVGLCYGEGRLYTKDAGDFKVFWQGPSVGYDAGAEGSKAMVLVYNMRDPSDIYNRFGGVQGSAYLVGGVSVQFQKYGDVTLAVIRSGVGVRLGANVGYLKYTRAPTWNPL
jgi:hypothetical protein